MMKKSQLVFVPSPGIGHLVSTIEFVKLFINHDNRLSITVFIIKLPKDTTVDDYTKSLACSPCFTERVQVINLPSDCNNSESRSGSFFKTLIENQKPHIKEAVSKLINSNSDPESPRLVGFIVDMFCTTMIDVANEFGVPTMVFFTSGVAFLGLMLHLHTLRERDNVDSTEFKDSETELTIPSFVNLVPARVLPTTVIEKEWVPFFFDYARRLKGAKGIIVNTFEALESHTVHSFSNGDVVIYPVGPILNERVHNTVQLEEANQGFEVIRWLDDQPPSSVIFLGKFYFYISIH